MTDGFSVQRVAIKTPDGQVHIMSIVERAPIQSFSVAAAEGAGFVLNEDGWSREVTDAVIEAEIARTPSVAVNSGWRRVKESDIPKDRTHRDKLTDDGKKLGHRKN